VAGRASTELQPTKKLASSAASSNPIGALFGQDVAPVLILGYKNHGQAQILWSGCQVDEWFSGVPMLPPTPLWLQGEFRGRYPPPKDIKELLETAGARKIRREQCRVGLSFWQTLQNAAPATYEISVDWNLGETGKCVGGRHSGRRSSRADPRRRRVDPDNQSSPTPRQPFDGASGHA